jgi:hypothetical protein
MITTRSHPRSRTARRLSWLVVAGLVSTALFAPGAAAPVFAAQVAPNADKVELVDGNPTCPANQYFSFKIDGIPSDGTTSNGVIDISNATDKSFDWAFNADFVHKYDMRAVIVKGGPNAYIYWYLDASDDSDTNLQSPDNPGENQADISHVEFCFDNKAGVEPTPTPTPTEEPTPTPTPTEEPTPTPTATPTEEPTPTPTPTEEPTPTPTPTGEVEPTATPTPTPVDPTATPTSTPSGEVLSVTGTPRVTLPPTDTLGASTTAPAGDNWRIVVLMMAGLLGLALLLTPASLARGKSRNR